MSRHKVELTGVNTANIEVLSSEEMTKLLKEYKAGNTSLKDRLVTGNLKLVLSILKRFTKKEENMDDLFQVGCIGLLKAIENFDTSYDVKFSTYAVPMIEGEVKRYLRDNSSIRVSRSIRELAYKIIVEKDKYIKDNNKEPTVGELAEALNVSKEDIIMSLDAIQTPISLQEPVNGSNVDNINVQDQISDKKNSDVYWAETITIAEAMKKLNDKEKTIINKRFFEGRTQIEVADEIGISQAQVSRLEKNAINHIKRLYK